MCNRFTRLVGFGCEFLVGFSPTNRVFHIYSQGVNRGNDRVVQKINRYLNASGTVKKVSSTDVKAFD